MVNHGLPYGQKHTIKLNSRKTEFVTSGSSHHPNPFIYVDAKRVCPKNPIAHHFSVNKSEASFDKSKMDYRISEMWGAVNAFITSCTRFCYPNSIFTNYSSIVISKLLYDLELFDLNKKLKEH